MVSVESWVRWYRWSLRLLPRGVRAAYGAEMEADIRTILADARRRGRSAALAGLLMAVGDVARRAPAEWADAVGARDRAGGLEWRVAVRSLRRRPGFTATAVVTLGLGMGATLAIWTVVQSILLRPLPYPDADRLVTVVHHAPALDLPDLENSVGTLMLYRDRARTLGGIAGTDLEQRNLTDGETPARVWVYLVSEDFFDVIGMQPAQGRRFSSDEVVPGPERVGILTHRAWRDRFGSTRDIIGRVVHVNDAPIEIVGVMPPGFVPPTGRTREGRADPDLLLPLSLDAGRGIGTFGIEGVMRLAPGVQATDAQAELSALQAGLEGVDGGFTAEWQERAQWSVEVIPLLDRTVGEVRRSLWLLLGTVALLLVIAAANVANLMLVRGEGRRMEVGVRAALGAGRRRIASVFLTEGLLLAAAGAVLGIAIAAGLVRLLVRSGPATVPRLQDVRMDGTVVLLAIGLTLLCGVALAIGPALRGVGVTAAAALHGGFRTTDGRERRRVRSALLVAQVALALMLLIGSGLLLRSFARLRAVDPGIRTADVVAVGVSRLGTGTDMDAATRFYQQVVDEVRALPGVLAVGGTSSLPILLDGINGGTVRPRSRPPEDTSLPPVTMYATILPGYFETMGMRLLEGRPPERADHEQHRAVAWVNEMFAQRFLDGRALDETIRIGSDSTWLEIAGVVNDVHTFGLEEEDRPMVYLPHTTTVGGISRDLMHIVIHHSGDPAGIVAATRNIVRRLDPTVPVTTVRTMDAVLARSMEGTTFLLLLLTLAAGMALLIGVVGLYGAISYVVAMRTREIGVRIALGADRGAVRGMVLRQGLAVIGVGLVAGIAGAAAATRVMSSLLFEVQALDPLTFIAMPTVLLAVGALAAWLPARRAAGVSALEALRSE